MLLDGSETAAEVHRRDAPFTSPSRSAVDGCKGQSVSASHTLGRRVKRVRAPPAGDVLCFPCAEAVAGLDTFQNPQEPASKFAMLP